MTTSVGPPGLPTLEPAVRAETAAHWRAMSPSRMLDYGMDYGDVLALWHATTTERVAWDVAAEHLADAQCARSDAAVRSGHLVTAVAASRAAIANLVFAQMAFNFDVPRKRKLYDRLVATVATTAQMAEPRWQRVELPFGEGRLFGWLVIPKREPARGTVVVFGGQSGWGAAYLGYTDVLASRGLATIVAEGPGQGESRTSGRVFLDVDVAAAYGTFVKYALLDPQLNGRIGLWGNSMGGLYAALTASANPLVSACCINGAPARPRLLDFRTFREQAAAMLGTTDRDAVAANFDRLRFDPAHAPIHCPVLVLHGGQDPLVSLDDQRPFLRAPAAEKATLKVWDDGEHTIYNRSAERTAFVADWFADQLIGTNR